MTDIAFATIAQLKKLIASKHITYDDVIDFTVQRFATYDDCVHALIELFDKKSLVRPSVQNGLLSGIPGVIKSNICIEQRRITCASKILENFASPYNATVVNRLHDQGAVVVGLANMDEFAMGSTTETSAYKKTTNPWDASRVPGGSSGGSAAAVAAGMVPWALGSDTGGSVRQPAALCGIVGMKPTYGRVSRYGLVAYGSSLDQVGVLTRTVYDNALVLTAIAGHDAQDSTTSTGAVPDYTASLTTALPRKIRIGVLENALYAEGMHPEIVACIEKAIKQLEALGAVVQRVTLPSFEYSAAAYFILSRAEAASNLARFDGIRYGMRYPKAKNLLDLYSKTRGTGFGTEVQSRIMVGNYVLASGHCGEYYDNAKNVQRAIQHELEQVFKHNDVLLMPTHPVPAFSLGQESGLTPLQIDLQDYFTCPMNIAGNPALSVPCGFTTNNLPIGMQFIGPHFSEQVLYTVAHAYESATEWHTQHPQL